MNSKWIIGAGAVVVLGLGLWGMQPTPVPPQAIVASSAESKPMVEVRIPAVFSENARIGRVGYDGNCAVCHGNNAAGQDGVAPPLVHKVYEPGHHADEAIQRAVAGGVRSHHWQFGNMPAINGLTRADVGYIIAYIRELQQENGIN